MVGWELLVLTARWRCLPFHYFRYRLYDVAVTLSHALAGGGIAKPALLGWRAHGVDAIDDSAPDCDVIIKPARYSSGGAGVMRLRLSGGTVMGGDGQPFDLVGYRHRWGDWILEELIEGAGGMPLRTLRVITMARGTGGPEARYVVQKLQAESTQVTDNAHSGGLYVGVDEATGQMGRYAYDETMRVRESDPVTGTPFAHMRVPQLPAAVRLAEAAAPLLPRTVYIGWDIGLSDRGPVVIEGNSSPGLTNIQRTHEGIARDIMALYRTLKAGDPR